MGRKWIVETPQERVERLREYRKRWRDKNRERTRDYFKSYYSRNRERLLKKGNEYRKAHREYFNNYYKEYNKAHKKPFVAKADLVKKIEVLEKENAKLREDLERYKYLFLFSEPSIEKDLSRLRRRLNDVNGDINY